MSKEFIYFKISELRSYAKSRGLLSYFILENKKIYFENYLISLPFTMFNCTSERMKMWHFTFPDPSVALFIIIHCINSIFCINQF